MLVEYSKTDLKNHKKLFVKAKIIDSLGNGLYECYDIPRDKSIYGSSTFISQLEVDFTMFIWILDHD